MNQAVEIARAETRRLQQAYWSPQAMMGASYKTCVEQPNSIISLTAVHVVVHG